MRVLDYVPAWLIRAVGRWQFRVPAVRWLVRKLDSRLTERDATIARGIGAGLRFNATGGHPGYLLGTSEPEEQEAVAQHLRAGDVFYDIGANVGFFTTIGGRLVGPSGQVFGFEPHGPTAARARNNAAINGFSHVTVVEAAVGATEGRMHLEIASGMTANRLSAETGGPQVEVIVIDGWRERSGAPAPSFVMIDVEGAEIDVLMGMLDTIRDARPTMLCEVHWLGDAFRQFFDEHLAPLGYVVADLEGGPAFGPARWHAVLSPEHE